MTYIPLKIQTEGIYGFAEVLKAARFPRQSKNDSLFYKCPAKGFGDYPHSITKSVGSGDLALLSRLVKAGDEHAKALRGIHVWFTMEMQIGWMIEFITYRVGVDDLSTTSAMHSELKGLSGPALANQKQNDLPWKVYKRTCVASYQALRRIYKQRLHHRHPDWEIFVEWIESLPLAEELLIC